jgi:signal transduction histidine kinase
VTRDAAQRPIRILLIEDSLADEELLILALRRGGYEIELERVETEPELRAALARQTWDVVVSDYALPQFSGPDALEVVRSTGIDVPFIIVSGTVGEEVAVAIMKSGANDYLLKGNLVRLGPAIEREMREAVIRAERRKMQEQLLISDRMASVGTLAAGVAHEINNPLAAIIANLEFLSDDFASGDVFTRGEQMRAQLSDAREGAERLRHIVRDLKVFSRSTEHERRGPVDVERVMESSLRMAWTEVRHRATVVKEYGNVPPVDALEARLGQVFLNLVVNAAHAIREGNVEGNRIRIATRVDDAGQIVVEIADTGAGIAPENLSRIFDAFFTTKPAGVGTGLGLSICHRIVTDLGGTIAVESELGKGTTFRLTLPRAGVAEVPQAAAPPAPAAAARRGRILLIDDDPAIGRTLTRLFGQDHDLTLVDGAAEALAILSSGRTFDVIFCDLMMPQMTGMDLHALIARDVPGQLERMVFMTGGAFTPGAQAFLESVPNTRIDKPFDLRQLRAIVAERLA